jgi:polysaccharide biosynthesis transport protein
VITSSTTANSQIDLLDILTKIKRRKTASIIAFIVVLLVGILVAIFMPPTYLSSATILIEQQEIPEDLVRSTVTSYADQRIQVITQRTMTYANLSEIIKKYNLYEDDRKSDPMEKIILQMRDDIKTKIISADVLDPRSGRPTAATIAFGISFQNTSPDLAQKVTNEITSLFLSENLRTRKDMAALTEEFLGASAEEQRKRVVEIEQKLSDFKQVHSRELPEYTQLNLAALERAETEYREQLGRLDSLEERRIFLTGELARLGATRVISNGDLNSLSPEDKLQYLYNFSMQLRAQYADNHPDVIRTNRSMDDLVAQGVRIRDRSFVRELIRRKEEERRVLAEKYAPNHPDIIKLDTMLAELRSVKLTDPKRVQTESNNPDYIQLASQLQAIEQNIVAVKGIQANLAQKVAELQKSLSESPKVEQDYRVLLRDLETTTRNYKEFDAKQTQAKMAKMLEQEQKGERFTLIEPPLKPERPIKPNRTLIIIFSIIVALLASAGVIWLLEYLDRSIRGEQSLTKLLGFSPLVVVPHLPAVQQHDSYYPAKKVFIAASAVLIAVVSIHLFYRPIDVIFYSILRKLGV